MSDSTRISSAWRTAHARGTPPGQPLSSRSAPGYEEDPRAASQPAAWLSFRDFAAIQIAAAMKGSGRDLSPRETAEVAFELAVALEDEQVRRHRPVGRDEPEPVPSGDHGREPE